MPHEIEPGQATYANQQIPLPQIKGRDWQRKWLLLACGDMTFSAAAYEHPEILHEHVIDSALDQPYSRLWDVLSRLTLDRGKWWLIGWRVQYALDKSDFLSALESGAVQLPEIKAGKNQGKHGGKLTCNKRILEIDCIVGKNKLKILDWKNFGLDPVLYVDPRKGITIEEVSAAFREFTAMADAVDVEITKSTAAQTGWNHCRRISGDLGLHVNLDPNSRRLERAAYFGGRCEAFRLGDIPGTAYALDVRSCYARICLEERLPSRIKQEYIAGCDLEVIGKDCDPHWIADVLIKTDRPDYPLRWQGTPIYPVGEFRTSLAWPELQHAIRHGRVQKIFRAASYQAHPVMRDYADWYLDARAGAGKAYPARVGSALKSIFNSSLGYTAREKYDWQPWDCQIADQYWLGTIMHPETQSTAVAAQILASEKRWLRVSGEPYEAMPYLHATICSYARMRLLEIFEAAGRENILYCDTDGVLVTSAGADRLRVHRVQDVYYAHGLVERAPPGHSRIEGQKSWQLGSLRVHAGVARTRLSLTAKKRVLTTETGRASVDGRVSPFEFRYVDGKNEMV